MYICAAHIALKYFQGSDQFLVGDECGTRAAGSHAITGSDGHPEINQGIVILFFQNKNVCLLR